MNTSSKNKPAYGTCVTISASTPRRMLLSLKRALAKSDYAEIRLDFLAPRDVPAALDLLAPHMGRCVCTLRPKREGGKFCNPEPERVSMLKLVAEYSPMLIDVEFDTIRSNVGLRKYISRTRTGVLVSWHNFERTPTPAMLRRKLAAMSRYSQTVKIVTMAKSAHDSASVLGLYAHVKKTRLIAFCMGNKGRVSRVLSLYLGCPFAYVSMGKPVAPGQFSLREMLKFLPR